MDKIPRHVFHRKHFPGGECPTFDKYVCVCLFQGQFVSEYVGDLIDIQEAQHRLNEAYRNNVSNFYMMTLDGSR